MIKQDNTSAGQKSGKSHSLHTHIFCIGRLMKTLYPSSSKMLLYTGYNTDFPRSPLANSVLKPLLIKNKHE